MNTKLFLIFLISATVGTTCYAIVEQPTTERLVPKVGEHCPDFTLTDVTHYQKKKVSLMDFKGKWLFLDFWVTTCTACIQSFPKINKLQAEFEKSIQFILVGKNDPQYNSHIKALFEKVRLTQGLNLASAYDSALFDRWEVDSLPHIVVIDPEGVVRYIIDGRDLTEERINDLLAGKTVYLYPKERGYNDFDPSRSLSDVTERKNTHPLIWSILTPWSGEKQSGGMEIDRWMMYEEGQRQGWSASMVPLFALYNYAYIGNWTWHRNDTALYGRFYHRPLLEISDTSSFFYDYVVNVGKGTYNYSLKLPPAKVTKEQLMKAMQQDLKRAFGYEVIIEKRAMSVWHLAADARAVKRIRTKENTPYSSAMDPRTGFKSFQAGFTITNQPIEQLAIMLTRYINCPIFIDATGITGNVDFTIEADMTNVSSIRRALREQGFDFEWRPKEMNVLVIKEGSSQ